VRAATFLAGALLLLEAGAAEGQVEAQAQSSPAPPTAPPPAPSQPPPLRPPDSSPPFPRYDDGFVLVPSTDPPAVPFRLKLKHVSQFKYTNSLDVHPTYFTHLGIEKDVLRRNDIQLTRDVFYFSGYAFDPRLDFNILLYTSSATLSATAAGYVGYVFNKAFALRVGFFSLPSARAMTGNYPFFHSTDRSMALNYFRPGFTQGIWAEGEPLPNLSYIAMVGNSLNTLDIAANRIDFYFAYAASIKYDWNNFGPAWNDYERHESVAIRAGTAFTFAREDRLSDLATASPENNATFISDGTLLFATGSLADGVTVSLANYYLWAIDFGLKFRGMAFNAEVYQRWMNKFSADGPLPIESMYDVGFEASLGYFVLRKRLETYGRTSLVHGPFRTGAEGAVGIAVYPWDTRQVWLSAEIIAIKNSPYGSVLYVYSAGQTGVLFPAQFLLRF